MLGQGPQEPADEAHRIHVPTATKGAIVISVDPVVLRVVPLSLRYSSHIMSTKKDGGGVTDFF